MRRACLLNCSLPEGTEAVWFVSATEHLSLRALSQRDCTASACVKLAPTLPLVKGITGALQGMHIDHKRTH
jgi:hypothetical protein